MTAAFPAAISFMPNNSKSSILSQANKFSIELYVSWSGGSIDSSSLPNDDNLVLSNAIDILLKSRLFNIELNCIDWSMDNKPFLNHEMTCNCSYSFKLFSSLVLI